MGAALRDIRVLDLTNVLAGPYCAYQLALMGADVIKVERPNGGDLARELGADPARNAAGMGISFLAQNAAKRSVTLNLKSSRGRDLLCELVKSADVLIENYRPGVMDRLGVGYDTLRQINPNLVYCAISGFGQTGPRQDDPAYDQIVQGVAGVMSVTGDSDSAPLRVGYPLADTVGGMTAAFAICAALNAKPRGTFLDIAMTDAVLSTMGWVVSNYLIGGVTPTPMGNENMTSAPSGTFATADRPINIAANRQSQWEALIDILDCQSLGTDPRFTTREDRKENRHILRALLEQKLITQSADHWVPQLNRAGVPAGPVQSVPDALSDPQTTLRNLVQTIDGLDLMGSPVVQNGTRPHAQTPPPTLGQHNDDIWREMGLNPDDIQRLRQEGIL